MSQFKDAEKTAKSPNIVLRVLFWLFKHRLSFWYIILLVTSLIYCIKNWPQVRIFNPFNGDSLLFIVMIGLCIMPFVAEFEVKGVKGKFRGNANSLTEVKEKELALQKTEEQYKQPVTQSKDVLSDIKELRDEQREIIKSREGNVDDK